MRRRPGLWWGATLLYLGLDYATSFSTSFPSKRVAQTQLAFQQPVLDENNEIDALTISSPQISRSAFLASLVAIPAYAVAADESTTTMKEDARQESISGFIAGAALTVTKTVVKYPLDTATVRLQMPNSDYSIRNLSKLFNGSYRGVLAPLLSNIPAGAVFFAVKDAVKASLSDSEANRFTKTAIAVAAAQFPYWVVRNPSEVVKTRQQARLPGYEDDVSVLSAYKQVRETRIAQLQSSNQQTGSVASITAGLDAFYTGYFENILYAYPADVIKFVAYDQLTGGRKNLPPAEGAMAGAAATAIAQLLTTPLDVVRNRIMAEKTTTVEKLSYTESLVQLARDEGVQGLFAGATPRVGKALLSGAIQFATYEETKQEIAKLFQRR